ncbi:MAG: SIMPL domain-containing protein [Parcubacteria group bacterium]|nr:SIMPL domain-containing protein [Parcubacteria group bacterium]
MATPRNWADNPATAVFIGLLLLSAIVYLSVATFNKLKESRYIGRPTTERDTISIQGEGKVTAVPDIGQITVGIVTRNKDVNKAQETNITQFNKLVEALKKEGIDKKDLTTSNYSVYPQYDYTSGQQTLIGYEVRQSLSIKIRNIDKSGAVITVAGQNGVNEVSGLTFTIDDPQALQDEAREEALVNAREKAARLSRILGVRLGKIVSFSESAGGVNDPRPYYLEKAMDSAQNGSVPAPSFEQGSQEIIVNANIEFEIY